jgi:GNAT superfamily N-acetyltransferase
MRGTMHGTDSEYEIRAISVAETMPLRCEVLRPGRPAETARFEGDEDSTTRHLGLFLGQRLVAIASLFSVECPSMPRLPAYQLRGMAVTPRLQSTGLGARLLANCIDQARAVGAQILWCNARTCAAGFYGKDGFQIVGEEFEIPEVGPHFRMVLKL